MIYELEHFLDQTECEKYIALIETNKTEGCPFTDNGHFENKKWVDQALASFFFERLLTFGLNDNILRPNKLVMSGKYTVGDSFGLHTDTGLFYDAKAGEKTKWTLLVYLNDDFGGGETIFYDNDWKETRTIRPQRGKAVLFDIDLWHRGNQLTQGVKWWIGIEIIGKMI